MLTSTKFFTMGALFSYGVYCTSNQSIGHVLAILSLFTYLITYLSSTCEIVRIDIIENTEIMFLLIAGMVEHVLFLKFQRFFKVPIKIGGLLLVLGFVVSIGASYYLKICQRGNNKGNVLRETVNKGTQIVVDSGPYAYVRHPVYLGLFLMVIGSLLHACAFFTMIFVLMCLPTVNKRICDEEYSLLKRNNEYEKVMKNTYYGLPRL